jgi:CheY-like chemotaxis protein
MEPGLRGSWHGDAGKLRQVLGNLASNAVKFTSRGEVRLTLRRTAAGVSFAVADTGVGIPGRNLAQLFMRFSQGDPSTTRRFGGSGLGLAISRELVELMGGSISVDSVAGHGSTFTVELPLEWISQSVGTEAEAMVQAQAERVVDPELSPVRILAAEDNRTNQILLSAMLDPLGVRLSLAGDGAEAVELFRAGAFDLVLMDIQMPVMNGVDAVLAIRAFEEVEGRRRTPVLALSANAMRHQVESYLAAGMDGFVAKPIDMAALIGAIEAALETGAAEVPAAAGADRVAAAAQRVIAAP